MWLYDTILQYITIGAFKIKNAVQKKCQPTVAFTRHINYLLS
ncbi:hypothetical protein T02_16074 [Trichinella nativa]|uniref:Uncharacterized protein n=1 Tax=Trichinella nativa TaxID=6335 RepID=A0A0V1KI08_9BILA|nr:hypothetical protein T02_16074 [Trichinella nativa]